MSFTPIASRSFLFKPSSPKDGERRIVVAVSAPYRVRDKSSSEGGSVACKVATGDDLEFAYEVFADDELETLELSLLHIEVFLHELTVKNPGSLYEEDGTPYSPPSTALVQSYIRKFVDVTWKSKGPGSTKNL